MSLIAARASFEYGNALLTKEEENPTDDLLNNVEGEQNEDEDEEGEDEDDEQDQQNNKEEDIEGDIQIAWETLDVPLPYNYLKLC